jgi:hypothetical protein
VEPAFRRKPAFDVKYVCMREGSNCLSMYLTLHLHKLCHDQEGILCRKVTEQIVIKIQTVRNNYATYKLII